MNAAYSVGLTTTHHQVYTQLIFEHYLIIIRTTFHWEQMQLMVQVLIISLTFHL